MSTSIQLPSDLDLDVDLEAKTVAQKWSFKTRIEAVAAFKALLAMSETGSISLNIDNIKSRS
jgi:hypothetical protein